MRFILGVGKSCPIAALFGETGWVPLSLTIKFNIIRFRLRLNRMEQNRIPYKMYGWSNSLTGPGGRSKARVNWANKTQTILDSIGDPAGGMTADEVWGALATQALGQWKEDVRKVNKNSESGGRLRFYKTTPKAEEYVENGLSLNKRRVITQIRTGCLPLEVETGRYRAPLANRKCQLCEEDIGDEVHLLLGCTKLENETQNLDRYLRNKIQEYEFLSKVDKARMVLELSGTDEQTGKLVYNIICAYMCCYMYNKLPGPPYLFLSLAPLSIHNEELVMIGQW